MEMVGSAVHTAKSQTPTVFSGCRRAVVPEAKC